MSKTSHFILSRVADKIERSIERTGRRPGTGLYLGLSIRSFFSFDERRTFLSDKRQRPREDVHEVGQPVGVRGAVELPDVHHVVLVLQDGGWLTEGEVQGLTVTTGTQRRRRTPLLL